MRRRLVGCGIGLALFIALLFGAVFPTRTYLAQRASSHRAEAELRQVQSEAASAAAAKAKLQSPAEVERRAREELGYVKPGEEAYNVLPTASAPVGLPQGWPFVGVEDVLRGG
jgi:cell division protein FtsB